jgi:hypothetical protein
MSSISGLLRGVIETVSGNADDCTVPVEGDVLKDWDGKSKEREERP